MKNRFFSIITAFLIILIIASPVLAQDYFFEVPEQEINVFIEPDGSLTIEYYYLFQNGAGAHVIDFVDVGMPGNSQYSLNDISATIDGKPINDIQTSPYVDGVALGLGGNAIPAGSSGIVYMRAENVRGQFYFASVEAEEEYTSMRFQPNYFESDFVGGNSEMTVNIYLPSGMTEEEPRWFTPSRWPGDEMPASAIDDQGRVLYQWYYSAASASGRYEFGVAFPARYIPIDTINTEQTVTFNPSNALGAIIPIACCGGFAGIFGLVIYFAAKSAKKRKLKYLPPKIAIEGHGIKRGLTSVEAAILLEQPMDKILSMILFSVLKKGTAEVTSREPLKIKVEETLPDDLREYEKAFLQAFKITNAASRRKALQDMMVELVKSVSTKMKGFSRKETVDYYKDIIEKAWKQVEEADTPEVRAERYSDAVDWTMMDRDYDTRTRRTFGSGPVYMPYWWWRADPGIPRTTASTRSVGGAAGRGSLPTPPSGGKSKTITLPKLPGSDAAASLTNTVTAMSAGAVGNLSAFTGAVTNKTNPVPKPSSSTFGSSGSRGGGGGSSCACACACAGCACACAGGGR